MTQGRSELLWLMQRWAARTLLPPFPQPRSVLVLRQNQGSIPSAPPSHPFWLLSWGFQRLLKMQILSNFRPLGSTYSATRLLHRYMSWEIRGSFQILQVLIPTSNPWDVCLTPPFRHATSWSTSETMCTCSEGTSARLWGAVSKAGLPGHAYLGGPWDFTSPYVSFLIIGLLL